MQKKDFEAVLEALKRVKHKSTAAIKDFLTELDAKSEASSLSGKHLTARARISALFDAGTFVETGAFIKRRPTEFDADAVDADDFEGVITGYGSVCGRLVFAFAEDFYRSKGAVGEAHAKKISALYDMAIKNGAPVVGIFDSCGAYVLEGVSALAGYGRMMSAVSAASGVVPQIAIVAGSCVGTSAAIASMFDFVIVSEAEGQLYVNAENKEENTAAVYAADEITAITRAKALLSYLPDNNCEGTVRTDCPPVGTVDVSFIENGNYSAASVVGAVADGGVCFELTPKYAPELLTALANIGGTAALVIATDPAANGGALTAAAAKKAARAVSFADSFNIPVVTLVDTKGLPNETSEVVSFASELGRLAGAYASASCPKVTVVTGRAYGAAFTVLGSKSVGADVALALSTAKIGALDGEAAVALLWDEKFAGSSDPAARRAELVSEWDNTFGSAVEAAYRGEIDDVIPAAELRARIASALEMLSMKNAGEPGRRHTVSPL